MTTYAGPSTSTSRGLGISVTTYTAPTVDPILLSDAKLHCNVEATDTDWDVMLSGLIHAATAKVETDTRLRLLSQTVDQTIDRFPCGTRPLPVLGMLRSVTSVTSYASDDTATTFATSNYFTDTSRMPGRICLKSGCTWPTGLRAYVAGVVRAVVGFGTTASSVPQDLTHAVRLLVGHWFMNRETIVVGTISGEIALTYHALIGPWIQYSVGDDE